jgi:hypothetical protein
MSRSLIAALSSVLLAGCSVVGIREGTEEPKFQVVEHVGDIEIRSYGARIAAETTIEADEEAARNAGFRRLAGYIFGGNTAKTSIAMTAPVAQSSETIAMTAPVAQARDDAGRWTIRFFMPASATMATLPTPTDPEVRLVAVPPQTIAVLRFTGARDADAVQAKRTALLSGLEGTKWQPQGVPVAWFYDPPWTIPFLRRNEVAVPVR